MGRTSDAREQLLAAAKEMIHSNSYQAVSVDELCAAAGVGKSSFYHFFSSKQDLVLATLESRWEQFETLILKPSFSDDQPPQEQFLHFFDVMWQGQYAQMQANGHVCGCPFGNLAVELSTQNEAVRMSLAVFFQKWVSYFEQALRRARAQGLVAETLDIPVVAQALLAYFEGVMVLAKGSNDPAVIQTLRAGLLSVMQYQEPHPVS